MDAVSRNELEPSLLAALQAAEAVLAESHCPHSGLSVGAALIMQDGPPVTGINYESDSYGLTLCAERTAIAGAQAMGRIREVRGIVISARWKAGARPGMPLTPCGACRQWLAELSRRLGRDLPVYSFWEGRESGMHTTALGLLPGAFAMDNT